VLLAVAEEKLQEIECMTTQNCRPDPIDNMESDNATRGKVNAGE
jgi:hypothetical protein